MEKSRRHRGGKKNRNRADAAHPLDRHEAAQGGTRTQLEPQAAGENSCHAVKLIPPIPGLGFDKTAGKTSEQQLLRNKVSPPTTGKNSIIAEQQLKLKAGQQGRQLLPHHEVELRAGARTSMLSEQRGHEASHSQQPHPGIPTAGKSDWDSEQMRYKASQQQQHRQLSRQETDELKKLSQLKDSSSYSPGHSLSEGFGSQGGERQTEFSYAKAAGARWQPPGSASAARLGAERDGGHLQGWGLHATTAGGHVDEDEDDRWVK